MNFPVVPQRMALVNVHMQNCFVEMPDRRGLALLERINGFAAHCRTAGMLVIHTREIWRADGVNAGVLGEIYPKGKEIFRADTSTAALHPRLVIEPGDVIVDAARYGAFHGTDLELIFRTRGIDSLVITGIATNIACDTTAREAASRDFHVFLMSDGTLTAGTGGLSAEETQRASLATLGALFAQVLSMDEMIEKIQAAGAA